LIVSESFFWLKNIELTCIQGTQEALKWVSLKIRFKITYFEWQKSELGFFDLNYLWQQTDHFLLCESYIQFVISFDVYYYWPFSSVSKETAITLKSNIVQKYLKNKVSPPSLTLWVTENVLVVSSGTVQLIGSGDRMIPSGLLTRVGSGGDLTTGSLYRKK